MPPELDLHRVANAVASGRASVAIEGGAAGARISTFVVEGDLRLELTAEQLDALRVQIHRALPLPRRNLPQPDPTFRGREPVEAALRAALEAGSETQAITALRGLGGTGKTELAVRVALALVPLYPAAQVLIDLRGMSSDPLTPQRVMQDVIARFEPTAKLPENSRKTAEAYRDLLRRNKAILILDNAHGTAQVLPLLPPAPSAAIVTSRVTLDLPGVVTRRLDGLERSESIAVLAAHLAERDPPENGLAALAAACVDHPLSLHVAGAYLSQRWDYIEIDKYAASIVANRASLAAAGVEGMDVMGALDLSVQMVAAYDAELAEGWRDLAVFPSDFDVAAAAAVWSGGGANDNAARNRLIALADFGMLEPGAIRGRFRIHELMRDLARLNQPETRFHEPGLRHATHFLGVLATAENRYRDGGSANAIVALALFDDERWNIEAGQAWAAAHLADSSEITELACLFPNAGVNLLLLRQHARTRIGWLKTAIAAARALGDRTMEAAHLGNLGGAHTDLNDFDAAMDVLEQAIVIDRETGNREAEGHTLGSLGRVYDDLGETGTAIDYYEQALGIARETGDRSSEAAALNNLGTVCAQGREFHASIDYFKQALSIGREIGDVADELSCLSNLGHAHADLEEHRASLNYYEQALAIAREIGDRTSEGGILRNLGFAYAFLGETRNAIDHFERGLIVLNEINEFRGSENVEEAMAKILSSESASKMKLSIIFGIGVVIAIVLLVWILYTSKLTLNGIVY